MFIDVTKHLTKLNNVLKECVFYFLYFLSRILKLLKSFPTLRSLMHGVPCKIDHATAHCESRVNNLYNFLVFTCQVNLLFY